jgi:hypothetical protein
MKSLLTFLFLITSISIYASQGMDPDLGKRLLVSVGDFENIYGVTWKKETCKRLFMLANQVSESGIDVNCRELDLSRFRDTSLETLRPEYDYHIRILKNKNGSIGIDITNWKVIHETDFKSIGWTIKNNFDSKITQEEAFTRALGNFFYYVSNQTAFKAGLLVNGVHEAKTIKYDQKKGYFTEASSGIPISINQAYSLYEKESPRKKNYLRAGIEIGVLLSAGLGWYYKELAFNKVDFDYNLKSGLKGKLTGKAILYDDNDKFANYGHTYAGVMYHQMARANGFNSLESFLITLASSTAWEFLEYHEILSINDEALTAVGGYVIGEASYQIACALLAKDNIIAKTLAYTVNPGLGINHGIDYLKSKNKFASQPDCQKARWSDISTYVGLDVGQKAYKNSTQFNWLAGLDATVINIENYGKTGKQSKLVLDTAMAKALIEMNGNEGLIDLKVVAQVMSAAYYQSNVEKDESGNLRGYEVLLGVGSASTWNDRGAKKHTKDEDFYGTVNILGATAHADIYYKGFNIKADIGFYGDLAMVKSYALNAYKESRGGSLVGEVSTIPRHSYYWGYGGTNLTAIAVKKGRFEIGYKGQFSAATSIHERMRKQSQILVNTDFSDSLQSNRFYISYQVTKHLKIELAQEFIFRSGYINDDQIKEHGREDRIMGTLHYQF